MSQHNMAATRYFNAMVKYEICLHEMEQTDNSTKGRQFSSYDFLFHFGEFLFSIHSTLIAKFSKYKFTIF